MLGLDVILSKSKNSGVFPCHFALITQGEKEQIHFSALKVASIDHDTM